MKKHNGLIVMAAVTVIAIAAALLDFKKDMDEETRREDESYLLKMKPDQISQIEFTMKDPSTLMVAGKPVVTNQFTLKKTSEGWQFDSPIKESADSDGVQQFIESLVEEKGIEVKGLGDNPGWEKFGLATPRGSLVFKDQLGKQLRIDISTKKNFEGAAYIRKDFENKVLLASPGWSAKAERKVIDFRDKRLLHARPQQIERMELTKGKDLYEFSWSDGRWTLDSKGAWKLDQKRVQGLIDSLTGPSISEYYHEGIVLPDDRKRYGVSQVEVKIKILQRGNKNWNARIGALKEGGYPVEILDPPAIVKISAVDGDRLVKLKPEFLRDRTSPFEFDKDQVGRIEVATRDKALELEKRNDQWAIVRSEGTKIDITTVPGLLDKIRALEAAEYLDPSETFNGKPLKTLQLKDKMGEVVFELELGASRKKKVSGVEKIYYKAQSSLVGGMIAIEEAKIKDLGIDQIFGAKK